MFCKDTNEQQSMLVAEKVREVVEQLKVLFNNTIIPVTISLGLVLRKRKKILMSYFTAPIKRCMKQKIMEETV